MAADRTIVTELATALGMLSFQDLREALLARSSVLRIDGGTWDHLNRLYDNGDYERDFRMAFENGRAFAAADDGLGGREPHLIEWTGGRRPPGDEVAPIDLRIDHVYLISCKYLSKNVANASPARLFDGLLATAGRWDRTDWYQVVASEEYQALYFACRTAIGLADLPETAVLLSNADRKCLREALGGPHYPSDARQPYEQFCAAVSRNSARRWSEHLADANAERMLWRLLRIGNAPYFLLGAHGATHVRLRVDTPWDWHHAFGLTHLSVEPANAGQPQVNWSADCTVRASGERRILRGHVEIRWSHGRFSQPPEAKVYLDTPIDQVLGYHSLEAGEEPVNRGLPGI